MKVSIIGAGNVGALTACRVFEMDLADVVLLDVVEGLAQGKALDLMHAAPLVGSDRRVVGTTDYDLTEGSDVVVITAGLARKPGMSREDLLQKNAQIVREVTEKVVRKSPDSILINVTNPLDVITYLVHEVSGFDSRRVVGMAGVLDSSRFNWELARAAGVSVKDVQSVMLGGHGDMMLPLLRHTTIAGIPATAFLPEKKIKELAQTTRVAGGAVVKLLGMGSAYFAPSAAVASMVEAILKDEQQVVCVSAYLEGQYGLQDIYLGVPVLLGRNGVLRVLELELSDEESSVLKASAETVRNGIDELKSLSRAKP